MKPETPICEILVTAYSKRYGAAVRDVLGIEGGYVNDPVDRGGATRFGISLRYLVAAGDIDEDCDGFADFDLDMDGDIDVADIRGLTRGDAIFLYHRDFWQPLECDSFPRPIGEMLFDQAVNGGLMAARKLLQRAINICLAHARMGLITVDGAIGVVTRTQLEWIVNRPSLGTVALVMAFRDAARERYRAIAAANPSQKRFLKGWLARADHLGKT